MHHTSNILFLLSLHLNIIFYSMYVFFSLPSLSLLICVSPFLWKPTTFFENPHPRLAVAGHHHWKKKNHLLVLPQLQQLPLSPPPITMTTNHQNHNQITYPNPQPHHHSPPTTRKRKRKTTLQNHNQIANPQPHHHQQSEKEKQPIKITNPNSQPYHHQQLEKKKKKKNHWERAKAHQLDDPCQSETLAINLMTHAKLLDYDPCRSPFNADAHAS